MEGQGHLLGKNYAFWLKEGQKLGKKRNEALLLSLATLHARSKFEVRSLAYACAVKI